MYGDRINQLDVRVAKTLRYRPLADADRARHLQRAELERGADLQQHVRARRAVAAAADDPDAAVLQDHRRDRLLSSHANARVTRRRSAMAAAGRRRRLRTRSARCRAGPRTSQKQVLVLYSTRRDAQIAVVGERELPRILEQGLERRPRLLLRVHRPGEVPRPGVSGRRFSDFLRLKYSGQPVRRRHRDAGRRPRVRRRASERAVSRHAGRVLRDCRPRLDASPNSTGVDRRAGPRPARSRWPPRCSPTSGTSSSSAAPTPADKAYESLARAQFQPFESRLAITYLSGLPTKDSRRGWRRCPQHSARLLPARHRDGAGENFHPLEYLDRVAAVANAPTYCWVDSAMDHGIVGGSLKSQTSRSKPSASWRCACFAASRPTASRCRRPI